jgi:hypothetical protein
MSNFRHTVARIERVLAWVTWIVLGIDTLILLLTPADADFRGLTFVVILITVVVLSSCLSTAVLLIHYRRFFARWYGLAVLVLAFIVARLWIAWEVIPSESTLPVVGNINLLMLIATINLMIGLGVGMSILLWHRDVSAVLIGLVLVAFVWGTMICSVPYGGPIQAWVRYATTGDSSTFWWLETLTCLLFWSLVVGIPMFVGHLVRLLVIEVQEE